MIRVHRAVDRRNLELVASPGATLFSERWVALAHFRGRGVGLSYTRPTRLEIDGSRTARLVDYGMVVRLASAAVVAAHAIIRRTR